jgi:hypothetical protein
VALRDSSSGTWPKWRAELPQSRPLATNLLERA